MEKNSQRQNELTVHVHVWHKSTTIIVAVNEWKCVQFTYVISFDIGKIDGSMTDLSAPFKVNWLWRNARLIKFNEWWVHCFMYRNRDWWLNFVTQWSYTPNKTYAKTFWALHCLSFAILFVITGNSLLSIVLYNVWVVFIDFKQWTQVWNRCINLIKSIYIYWNIASQRQTMKLCTNFFIGFK